MEAKTMPEDLTILIGGNKRVRPEGSTITGVEDARAFPFGEWTRLYVPTERLADALLRLEGAPATEVLTKLLIEVVDQMQSDDGEPVLVMSEPDGITQPQYRTPAGTGFDLRPAFDDETWGRLLDTYEQATEAISEARISQMLQGA